MRVVTSKTREQFPLSTKKVIKKTLSSVYIWIIFIIMIIFVFTFGSISAFDEGIRSISWATYSVIFAIFLLVTSTIYFYEKWYYAVYFYDLTPDYIVIRKGPITPSEITIPYERIQDVYVDQDLLDRIFGLYDVHLSSATISSGMAAHIDGVEKEAADGLRKELLETVSERIGKKATTPSASDSPVQATNK